MPSEYIAPGEYESYGLPGTTTSAQVQRASAVVDAILDRKKGFVWSPDSNGQPCYMAGASASMSWQTTVAIAAGTGVVVALNGKPPSSLVGQPVLIERATAGAVEACVVSSVDGANVTLDQVQNAHGSGVTVEAGMFLEAHQKATGLRPSVFAREYPIAGLLSVRSRFSGGPIGLADGLERYGLGWNSGLYPVADAVTGWTDYDITTIEFEPDTGQIFIPCGQYADVKVHYVAGYSASAIPAQIKMATAQIVAAQSGDALGDQVLADLKEAFAIRRVSL